MAAGGFGKHHQLRDERLRIGEPGAPIADDRHGRIVRQGPLDHAVVEIVVPLLGPVVVLERAAGRRHVLQVGALAGRPPRVVGRIPAPTGGEPVEAGPVLRSLRLRHLETQVRYVGVQARIAGRGRRPAVGRRDHRAGHANLDVTVDARHHRVFQHLGARGARRAAASGDRHQHRLGRRLPERKPAAGDGHPTRGILRVMAHGCCPSTVMKTLQMTSS